ncbi:putative ribonuclease H-like domain-containing protein [Tanacetum coccineum]
MNLETAQTTATAKFPILKQGEYDMWRLRIEQYFQVQDYALWDVIENGNSFKPAAQTTQKAMYLNFTNTSTRMLRLCFLLYKQDLALEDCKSAGYLGENISQEDLNLKILRSLPSEWNTHVVVWRNKPNLDTMSFDDLYNNFKIVEQEVKRTTSSSSSSQNIDFVSSPSSTNEVNTAYGVSTANTQVSPTSTQDLKQIHEDDLEEMDLKWQLALLSMRTRRFFQKTGRKITINGSDTAGYDKNQDSSRRTVNVEETSSKAMVAIDGAGFDWSYMADNEVPTNMALMAFSDSEFNRSEFNLATYKRGLASVEEQLIFYKKNEVICEQLAVLKRDISYKDSEISMLKRLFSPPTLDLSNSGLEEFQQPKFEGYGPKTIKRKPVFPNVSKIEFVKPKQQEKPVRKPVKYDEMYRLTAITIKGKGCPKVVNTTRPNSAVVNVVRENQATLDESMLWYRRLGHVNFKTINKLVKENLVRGLPTKHFENNQTCVACLKGKQHKASSLDYYSRFTWVFFLATKDETSGILKSFITEIENLVDKKVKIIRCDNGTEFKNRVMSEFCEKKGIKKEFSAEAVNTACYVQNRVLVVKPYNKTPYELFRGRTPALSFMRPFGCHVTILNTLDYLGKFDGKSDEGFFVGYSLNSKAFKVYNIRTRKVEENLHIRFLEDKPIITGDGPKWLFDIDVLTKSMNYVPVVAGTNSNDFVGIEESIGAGHSSKETGSSQDYILIPLMLGKKEDEGVSKESGNDDQERPENSTQVVNTVGPSINTELDMFSLGDNATLEATHADFFSDETEVNMSNITTTYLVPSIPNTRIHKDHSLDHVFRNKKDKRGIVIQNKARLVIQGHTQEEGIDYDDVFAPVARIEAIRLFLAYASLMGFILYQMDMKSTFLYGRTKEEVYVYQPLGFEDPDYPDKVYNVVKALYSLHQAPRACSMGELTFFLGLQVKQKEDGIFISRDKYVADILRKFSFTNVRTGSTLMDTEKPLLKDSDGDDVDVHLYKSMIGSLMYLTSSKSHLSDYARASLDGKSTTGGFQFLGCKLISWQCKKQTVVATSSTESEYVAAASCFLATATAKTLDNGEIELTAIIDSTVKTVTEASGPVVQGEGSTHPPRSPTQSPVADEAASTGVDVRYGGATTTVTGLEVG